MINLYRRPNRAPLLVRLSLPLMLLMVLSTLLAPLSRASASDLVNSLGSGHVYVDPGAKPKLDGADKISQQVADVEAKLGPQFDPRSPFKAIIVVDTTDDSVSIDDLRQALADKHGGFSGAIVLINHHGYVHAAYDVSKGWAAANNILFDQARDSHRGNVYGTVSDYLTRISTVTPDWTPPPPPKSEPINWHPFLVVMEWIAGLIAASLAAWGLVILGRRRADRKAERDRVHALLSDTRADVNSLGSDVYSGLAEDVTPYHLKAVDLLGDAESAYEAGDIVKARSYATKAAEQVTKADNKLNPDKAAIKSVPKKDRRAVTVQAKTPTGSIKTVDNTDYSPIRTGRYRHYYQGGPYNDVYFYPGYYPYPFWAYNWGASDVVVGSATVPDQWSGDYDNVPVSSGTRASDFYTGPSSSDYASSGAASSGFTSGYSSPSPSHHSSSSSSSSSSSYSSPSYDSGSSFSGFDSGGSFGGGGFDSGSGSSGF